MIQAVASNRPTPTASQCGRQLTVDVCRPTELTVEQEEVWRRILRNGLQQNSPFLHPEFVRAAAAVRNDVEVAILQQGAAPVGFFPFQRSAWNIGKPVGGRLSSYQGIVIDKDVEWNAERLVRGCGLTSWNFDQLDLDMAPFRAHAREAEGAAYLDLSEGYETYRESRRAAGSQRILKVESLFRKLQREAGFIRCEFHSPDPKLVETLLDWKSAQYRETGLTDVFSSDWTVNLLERILARPTDTFSAVVSALYDGARPVAISYALRTENVLHGMFIGFDREYSRYSPGLILLLEMAREGCERGIRRFHLGSGGDHYKRSLASGEARVGSGSVDSRPLVKLARRGWELARRAAHSTALAPLTNIPLKWMRPIRERLDLR